MNGLVENGMKQLVGSVLASAALAAGCGTEDAAQAPSGQRATQGELGSASTELPAGYVQTPFGRAHQSCVHELPDGAEVDIDGAIRLDNQVLRAASPCAFQRLPGNRGQASSGATHDEVARKSDALAVASIDGWVSSIEAPAINLGVFPPRFNGIESTLTIPPTPAHPLFQLIYLFVSLTPADGKAILQPVIKFTATGKWQVAGWFIDRADNQFHTPWVNVSAGEAIKGTIRDVRNSCVGTSCTWDIKLYRGNSAISSLRVTSNEAWALAQKAVLEAYGVTSCRQLPSGNALFLNTKVYAPYDPANVDARIDVTGSLSWKKVINSVTPWCAFNAVFPNPQTGVLTWSTN